MSIEVSQEEYRELKDAQEKLELLEAAGVDNWEFYGNALEDFTPSTELYRDAQDLLQELTEGARVDYPAGRDAGHQIIFSESAIEKVVELLRGE